MDPDARLIEALAELARKEADRDSHVIESLVGLFSREARARGVDIEALRRQTQARSSERRQSLAQRLQLSVHPLFVKDDRDRPERLASCVLVRVDEHPFAFTAGHVLRDAGTSVLWSSSTVGTSPLERLPCRVGFQSDPSSVVSDLDAGVLPLSSSLGVFAQCHFLEGSAIDEADLVDQFGLDAFYFVLGYPSSRSQSRFFHPRRRVNVTSFQLSTSPLEQIAYERERMPKADHILLDYDDQNINVGGVPHAPPSLPGVSGGGIFYITRRTLQGPLVAIITEHRRHTKLIAGTRLKHFLATARHLIRRHPELFR